MVTSFLGIVQIVPSGDRWFKALKDDGSVIRWEERTIRENQAPLVGCHPNLSRWCTEGRRFLLVGTDPIATDVVGLHPFTNDVYDSTSPAVQSIKLAESNKIVLTYNELSTRTPEEASFKVTINGSTNEVIDTNLRNVNRVNA